MTSRARSGRAPPPDSEHLSWWYCSCMDDRCCGKDECDVQKQPRIRVQGLSRCHVSCNSFGRNAFGAESPQSQVRLKRPKLVSLALHRKVLLSRPSQGDFISKLRQQQQNEVTIECNVCRFIASRISCH